MTAPRPSTEARAELRRLAEVAKEAIEYAKGETYWTVDPDRYPGVLEAYEAAADPVTVLSLLDEAEARLATPGSDVRELLAQAIHEQAYPDKQYPTHDHVSTCEWYADLYLATPSGMALARLATAGPDEPTAYYCQTHGGTIAHLPLCRADWCYSGCPVMADWNEHNGPKAAGPSEREAALIDVQDFVDEADAMGCSIYLVGKRVNGKYHVTVYDGSRDFRTDGDTLDEAIRENLALHALDGGT